MQTVFDAPMTTPPGEQGQGVRQVARDAGDGEVDLDCLLAVAVRGPLDATDLLSGRPIEMAGQTRGGLEMAMLPARVACRCCGLHPAIRGDSSRCRGEKAG